ncbi:MAG: hypothetical protein JSR82_09755 [Verrucomicrobia bacterium]|nr:hypothetical protein [Verrucomicrobiota bacterium]
MSVEQYRLLFASANAHLSNVVFDAFVTAGRGRVEARLVSALAQARVFATRAPCDIVLLDANLGSTDLLETMQEIRRERADLLIAVLDSAPNGTQRAVYLNAGARLIVAPPTSLEETEALLVQVISALHALRQPVAPLPPAPVTPVAPPPAVAPPAQTPLVQRRDSPLFAAPSPAPAAPAAPAPPRPGALFQAPAPTQPPQVTPQVRRSDAPLFPREPGAPPATTPSIRPAAIRLAESQAGSLPAPLPTASPAAKKLTGTRTISLPVARPAFADPVANLVPPAEPEPPPVAAPEPAPAPEPPPVAPPAPVDPPAQERPRTSNFRFTQLIKNIKPVSLPPRTDPPAGS